MKKICFAVGGTGGHMIPAYTLAAQVSHACSVFFCGVGLSHHKERLQEKTIPFYSLTGGTPFYKNPIRSLTSIFLLLMGVCQCWKIYRKEKPDIVVGFGSFHSFPALLCAYLCKVPIILFESNLQMGRVNQFCSSWCSLFLGTFKESYQSVTGKCRQVALPIYKPFGISTRKAREYFGLDTRRPTLLVTGGSLGARYINEMILGLLPKLSDMNIQVIHLVGASENISLLREKYELHKIPVALKSFEKKMYFAWSAADMAICRSGAATLNELIEFEVPTITIPYPFSSRRHQISNATYFSNVVQGGITIYEGESTDFILQSIHKVWKNRDHYRKAISLYKRKQFQPPLYQIILEYLQIPIPFHLFGIGGIGMSALAQILLERRYLVYGSDSKKNERTAQLQQLGAIITIQSELSKPLPGACLVYSSAIPKDDLESITLENNPIPVLHRSDLLDQFMKEKIPLLVTGTHGKTTTSAMLTHVLQKATLLPSYVIGGRFTSGGKHGHMGRGSYFVGEADESDGSFLRTPAYGAIVTNVENDHMEYWHSEKNLQAGFDTFLSQVTHSDLLLLCADDPYLGSRNISAIRYGFSIGSEYRIRDFHQEEMKSQFTVSMKEKTVSIELPLIGTHNARNATAVLGLCMQLGIDTGEIISALKSFPGVSRRCEYKGVSGRGGVIYDDYAHHPTEILSTLQAIKQAFPKKRLVALFQPHRYSRLQLLLSEFATSLSIADYLIITDIYSAGEKNTLGTSSVQLISSIKNSKCIYIDRNQVVDYLHSILQEGDLLITMGAGDVTEVGEKLLP